MPADLQSLLIAVLAGYILGMLTALRMSRAAR
jgi:hypothetical protein